MIGADQLVVSREKDRNESGHLVILPIDRVAKLHLSAVEFFECRQQFTHFWCVCVLLSERLT